MLKLSSSRGIRIDVPVLSVSWSFEDHSVIIQALRKGLIEHEASDTGGVPRWKSSCPDRLAEATVPIVLLSIWCNVCACHSSVYHYIAATVVYLVQRIIAACVVVI